MTQKSRYKISQPFFVYPYCTSENTNLDRKGTSNYNLCNTGQNLDKQKFHYFCLKILVIYKFIHIPFTYIQTDIKITSISTDTGGIYFHIYNLDVYR